ncbi:hypothetical protein [Nocardioides daeguensis]|uniref:Glycosyl hydrolase family 98 putative carbohydrate-binding module domain-containing protein n=1 Tax=Nocardioides daeguensis TaxID=908359 RepID=A0ABP6W056_9ACTN|nr:hypothetical protein [Nocardioides daeguensis]MBV6726915.1 hypothetical protein [Nocardioides daeguensis]MCR1772914.1 hypothetical protein [Nocardioides daeguensis]
MLALATPAVAAPATPAHATARAASSAPSIDISVRSNQVERGKKVVVTGTVTGKKVTKVTLQQKRAGTPWKAQATVKVKADGSFLLKDKTTTAVIRKYRVVSASGPRTRSAKVTVGVYAWADLTKRKARSSMRWSQQKTVAINGTSYGLAFTSYNWGNIAPLVDFNVNRNCIALRARFGLSDNSDAAARATVSVVSDGSTVYAKSFGLTESELATVPIASPFRVGITATVENPGNLTPAPNAIAVAAEPEILCTSAK